MLVNDDKQVIFVALDLLYLRSLFFLKDLRKRANLEEEEYGDMIFLPVVDSNETDSDNFKHSSSHTLEHLDFNNLVGSYDSSAYPDLRGWGELSHPSGPVASVGSWAAPTSPPAQPHNAEEADRPHEDSVKTLLISYLPSHFSSFCILSWLCQLKWDDGIATQKKTQSYAKPHLDQREKISAFATILANMPARGPIISKSKNTPIAKISMVLSGLLQYGVVGSALDWSGLEKLF